MSDDNRVEEKEETPAGQPEGGQPAPEAVEAQPEEAPDLETQLQQAQALAAEYLDGWQRARAELDNYRKRMTRERTEWEATIRGDVIVSLLPALDDFDLALANLPGDIAKHEWANGLILVHRKLHGQIEAMGLKEIEAIGQPFDPALHEAVTHEHSDDHQPGEIVGVVRKGYCLGDRVIRVALVRVAN